MHTFVETLMRNSDVTLTLGPVVLLFFAVSWYEFIVNKLCGGLAAARF